MKMVLVIGVNNTAIDSSSRLSILAVAPDPCCITTPCLYIEFLVCQATFRLVRGREREGERE